MSVRVNNHSHNVAMFRTYQNCAMRYLFQGRTLLTEGSNWLGASDIFLGRGAIRIKPPGISSHK